MTYRLVAVGLLAAACGREPARPPSARPSPTPGNGWNVLFVTIDTLRADRLGTYGYQRPTSPRMDALAREGTVFERAYTFWPKTRASFVMMLTGRRPSQNGYSHRNPTLLDFNPTLASVLRDAGYRTAAIVDNANLAKAMGYAKGFQSYREVWEEPDARGEWPATLAITQGGIRFLREQPGDRPFFLWLHYVNPHAPYTPPAPFDSAFLGPPRPGDRELPVVKGFHGGVPEALYVPGRKRLGYYLGQYDGEVAAVDQQVGQVWDALKASRAWGRTLVVVTSDHGESLGEHDYYFDHGEDLFDPCLAIPLIVVAPGGSAAHRSRALASTLDILPTVLDAVKVPYPPDLAGESLLGAVLGAREPRRGRLFAQNDRNLAATFDGRMKLVARFGEKATGYTLYDREVDPGETRDLSRERPDELRAQRQELDRFLAISEREWTATRRVLEGVPTGEPSISPDACERLKALGYVDHCP